MLAACLALAGFAAAEDALPPKSHLLRVAETLELCRADIPAMNGPAETAAAKLQGGGSLYAGGVPSFISEMCGRAGGLMAIRPLRDVKLKADDVVLFAPGSDNAVPGSVSNGEALIILFGSNSSTGGPPRFSGHAEAFGVSPTLAAAAQAWIFTGELVAALTRLGAMPVMFESIGMYGGYARMDQYIKKGVFYHEQHDVPPIAPGVLGERYIDAVVDMLKRVQATESDRLERTASMAAEARAHGKRLVMYSMGHLFPDEVGETAIAEVFESAVWNAGFFAQKVPEDTYSPGDVLIHIGYQHPPYRLLERARPQGARVAYVSVLQHRDFVDDPGVVWIDPMWSWCDACVKVEGYDIPILPASGIVNGAIAWEIHRRTLD